MMTTHHQVNFELAKAFGLSLDNLKRAELTLQPGGYPLLVAEYEVLEADRLAEVVQRLRLVPTRPAR